MSQPDPAFEITYSEGRRIAPFSSGVPLKADDQVIEAFGASEGKSNQDNAAVKVFVPCE